MNEIEQTFGGIDMFSLWRKYSYAIIFMAISFFSGAYFIFHIEPEAAAVKQYIVVEEGDSLLSLAAQYADDNQMTIEEFIEWVQRENQLLNDQIVAGDNLIIPVLFDQPSKQGFNMQQKRSEL